MNELDNLSPSAPRLLLGDFNGCSLRTYIPTYKQCITCTTRGNKTIDLCYCNIKNAYKSVSKPPLGTYDHNIIQLLPTYKSVLKTVKIVEKPVTVWNDDGTAKLRGCFECTTWETLYDSCSSVSNVVDTVTEYMNFCVDTILPKTIVKIYPNEKPWVTKEVKKLLKAKQSNMHFGQVIEFH